MAKKILKLDTSSMQDDFFSDVALIGIASSKPFYSLCNIINKSFDLAFSRKPPKDIMMSIKGTEFSFPVYQHTVPLSDYRYTLYKLKINDALLLPTAKNIDYVWMVHGITPVEDAIRYISHLRNMPAIQLASLLDADKIKDKEYLIM